MQGGANQKGGFHLLDNLLDAWPKCSGFTIVGRQVEVELALRGSFDVRAEVEEVRGGLKLDLALVFAHFARRRLDWATARQNPAARKSITFLWNSICSEIRP